MSALGTVVQPRLTRRRFCPSMLAAAGRFAAASSSGRVDLSPSPPASQPPAKPPVKSPSRPPPNRGVDARQPWLDGRFATEGASYLGFTRWALLMDPPPELATAVVAIAPHDVHAAATRAAPSC